MKNNSIIIIISVILVLAIAGIGFWITNKSTPEKNSSVAIEANEPQVEDKKENVGSGSVNTSDWNTYRDEKYKFEIRYNPDWEIRKVTRGPAIGGEYLEVIVDKNKSDIGMGINRFEVDKNPKEWYKEQGILGKTFDKEYYINDASVYYVEINNPRVYLLHNYFVSNKKSLIDFSFIEKGRNLNTEAKKIEETSYSQYLSDFEAMVNSIKFFD